jgi:predicted dehydrogenase
MTHSRQHRVLIIGCGSIGERHLRCFQKTGRATVAACDSNPTLLARMAEVYGVETFESSPQAVSRGWDAVVICVPAHLHVRMALMALANGCAAFIEKPLAVDGCPVDLLLAEAVASKKFNAVAYVYHNMPWVVRAREELQKGTLGRPLHVAVVCGQHFPTFRPAYREIYYTRHETGGGAIQDALTHVVNAVEWLIGPITRVYADAAHQMLEGVTVEDTVNLAARHGDILASYALNQFQAPNEATIQIHCEHGSLRIESHTRTCSIQHRNDKDWTHIQTPPMERDDLFIAQANAFLDGMEGKPTPLSTIEEAAQTLRVNAAALRSMKSGLPEIP